MSMPLEHGRSWFEHLRVHGGAPLILSPRDEIDLATYVLDQVVAETDGRQIVYPVSTILTTIRDRSKSVSAVVCEIDKFIGRLGTSAQKAHWKTVRAAVA